MEATAVFVISGFRVSASFLRLILAEFAAERLIHQRVDGLGDADNAGEDDAPPVAVEAVGGGDSDHAEQDAHAETGQAHVGPGTVALFFYGKEK